MLGRPEALRTRGGGVGGREVQGLVIWADGGFEEVEISTTISVAFVAFRVIE